MICADNYVLEYNNISIGPTSEYTVSPDKTMIASVMYSYPSEDVIILDKNYGKILAFYVYDIIKNEIHIIKSVENDGSFQMPWGSLIWSPDSKVISLDIGTSPIRKKVIANVSDPNIKIFSLDVYKKDLFLTNDNIIFTGVKKEFSFYNAFSGDDAIFSVLISDFYGNIRTMKEGSRKESFRVKSILDNLIIIKYEMWNYEPPEQEGYPPHFYIESEKELKVKYK